MSAQVPVAGASPLPGSATPPEPLGHASFLRDIEANSVNRAILQRWHLLDLPQAWLVAGCLFQTIWNHRAGRAPEADIRDYDLFYFDAGDLSADAEARVQAHVDAVQGDLGGCVEVANQARVHLWYPEFFGLPYAALDSAESGIEQFLVRETCVGVRPGAVCAPHGLEGVYAGTLTSNARMHAPVRSASARLNGLVWNAHVSKHQDLVQL